MKKEKELKITVEDSVKKHTEIPNEKKKEVINEIETLSKQEMQSIQIDVAKTIVATMLRAGIAINFIKKAVNDVEKEFNEFNRKQHELSVKSETKLQKVD